VGGVVDSAVGASVVGAVVGNAVGSEVGNAVNNEEGATIDDTVGRPLLGALIGLTVGPEPPFSPVTLTALGVLGSMVTPSLRARSQETRKVTAERTRLVIADAGNLIGYWNKAKYLRSDNIETIGNEVVV
jgi:uncharacterized protein YcfJ